MDEKGEGEAEKRERVAAWTGFYRDYIKPVIYPEGFAPNSHRSVRGIAGGG